MLLTEFEQETGAFADYASRHRLPVITPELLQACIEKTGDPVQTKFVTDFVTHRLQAVPCICTDTKTEKQKKRNGRKIALREAKRSSTCLKRQVLFFM